MANLSFIDRIRWSNDKNGRASRKVVKSKTSQLQVDTTASIETDSDVYRPLQAFGPQNFRPQCRRDLWKEAFGKLQSEERDVLEIPSRHAVANPVKPIAIVHQVITDTRSEYQRRSEKLSQLKEECWPKANVREKAKELLSSSMIYVEFINQAVQFDPSGYAKPIWTIISSGLTMAKNDMDRVEAVFESSAFLAGHLTRYAAIEVRYLNSEDGPPLGLEDAIVDFYVALFQYSAEVKQSLTIGCLGTAAQSLLNDLSDHKSREVRSRRPKPRSAEDFQTQSDGRSQG